MATIDDRVSRRDIWRERILARPCLSLRLPRHQIANWGHTDFYENRIQADGNNLLFSTITAIYFESPCCSCRRTRRRIYLGAVRCWSGRDRAGPGEVKLLHAHHLVLLLLPDHHLDHLLLLHAGLHASLALDHTWHITKPTEPAGLKSVRIVQFQCH